MAKATKMTARTPAITRAGTRSATQEPTSAASAWLAMVAVRMPAMTTQGRRNRAASDSASSWVLSPISLIATRRNELTIALIGPRSACGPG